MVTNQTVLDWQTMHNILVHYIKLIIHTNAFYSPKWCHRSCIWHFEIIVFRRGLYNDQIIYYSILYHNSLKLKILEPVISLRFLFKLQTKHLNILSDNMPYCKKSTRSCINLCLNMFDGYFNCFDYSNLVYCQNICTLMYVIITFCNNKMITPV